MSKKVIFFFTLVIFLSKFHTALAGLLINEVMYDLSGSDSTSGKSREWVEVYNSGNSAVSIDASKWRIYDGGGNRTINGEVDFSIPALSYIIFAGDRDTFLTDNPSFTGVVYDTGITSLNNTGATLKLIDQDGNAVDTLAYTSDMGAAGDGNSLQKISSSFVSALPTPGIVNESVSTPPPTPTPNPSDSWGGGNLNLSTPNKDDPKNKTEIKKIKANINRGSLAFVGMPVSFEPTFFGHGGEALHYGRYFLNFGDGSFVDVDLRDPAPVTHTYMYKGEYSVLLEYFMTANMESPDASEKLILSVIDADVVISATGDEKDFFIELSNNSLYDIDLAKWSLMSDGKIFIFPRGTMLGAKKKIKVAGAVTHFSLSDKNTLRLLNSQGVVVFGYVGMPNTDKEATPLEKESVVTNTPKTKVKSSPLSQEGQDIGEFLNINTNTPLKTIEPATLTSEVVNADTKNTLKYPVFALFAFLGMSAGSVYFIRQKRVMPTPGDDFNILDE